MRRVLPKVFFALFLIGAVFVVWKVATPGRRPSEDAPRKATLQWHSNLEDAKVHAQREGKPMLVDFWADWCVPCHEMDRNTYAHPEVITRLKQELVLIKLDVSSPTEYTSKWQQEFRVMALPHVVILDANGKLLPNASVSGYQGPTELLALLDRVTRQVNESGQCVNC